MHIKIKRMKPHAKTPLRGHPSDAGLDVFYCAETETEFKTGVVLLSGQNARFGTGFAFEIPHGFMLQVMNRSSMASKNRMLVGAHVIDPNYAGEVFIDLHNVGTEPVIIKEGDKIAQLVMMPIITFDTLEVEEIYTKPIAMGDRGAGALGSTGE